MSFLTIAGGFHNAFADIPAPPVRDTETHVRGLQSIIAPGWSISVCRSDTFVDQWGSHYSWTVDYFSTESDKHVRHRRSHPIVPSLLRIFDLSPDNYLISKTNIGTH